MECIISPPKIKSIRIVDNPFDDIVPRITAAEKRAQQKAREEVQREREEMQRRKGAKKCVHVADELCLLHYSWQFLGTSNYSASVQTRALWKTTIPLSRRRQYSDPTVRC